MRFVSLAIGSFGVRRLIPYVLLTISAICWAGNLTVGRYVYPDVMPATLSFWRWFIASVILAVIFLPAVRQQWQVVVTHWKYLFLLALSGVLMFHLLVYWSLRMTTTLNAALIISLAPVIIVVLSRWILRTSITLKQTLGVAVSLVGACVVIVRGDLSVLRSVALNSGDLLMLVALPNWALYSVLLKRKPPKLDPRAMLVATLFIGLVMTIPFTLWEINNT
ncbi:MAG: DMT family transporter [Gammaproteobacteria bacterium]|nr:DMT family transporter [Gammaproteobacteria bacterium]